MTRGAMGDEAASRLGAELGAEPPPQVAALDDAHVDDLARSLSDARRRQRVALAQATDAALDHLPRLVRGVVRRVVGA